MDGEMKTSQVTDQAAAAPGAADQGAGTPSDPKATAAGSQDGAEKEKTYSAAEMEAALADARKKWEKEAAEAERVKKLSPEEKAADDQAKKDAKIADLQAQIMRRDLKDAAVDSLRKEKLPEQLSDVLDYSNEDAMKKSLKTLSDVFKSSLSGAVQTRLRGKTPEGLGAAAASENMIADQIAKNIRGL